MLEFYLHVELRSNYECTYLYSPIVAEEGYVEVGGVGRDLESGVEGALGGRRGELDGERSVPVRLGREDKWALKGKHL